MTRNPEFYTYIVLVNWNGWRDTVECLESLFQIKEENYKIVVCDNGSQDNSLQHIIDWASGKLDVSSYLPSYTPIDLVTTPKPLPFDLIDADNINQASRSKLILIDCKKNLGFAGACNIGIRFSQAQGNMTHIWLLNNDTVIPPDSLSRLLEKSKSDPTAGIIGSTVIYYHEPHRVQAFGGARYFQCIGLAMHIGRFRSTFRRVDEDSIARKLDYVMGASMLVTRKFINTVGLMAEDYFLYYEELDWALRGKSEFSLSYAFHSFVYHKAGSSIGSSSSPAHRSFLSDSYLMRNRIKITQRHFPQCILGVRMFLLLELILRLLRRQPKHAAYIWNLIVRN